MTTLITRTCALIILLATYATAQMVEGNIIDSVTGAGIPRVAVTLMPASDSASDDEPYNTVTDPLGHFAFSAIKPGTYVFSWFSQAYLRIEATPFPQVHVTAGGEPLKLEGRMTPMPTISGRVVDSSGNGVANAGVTINGPSVKAMATTDISGNFEQHLPQSGRYSVSVTPPPGMTPPAPEPGSDQPRVWTPVYYPGVTLREAASKIVVHPGDRISGVELKLIPVPAHIVRGMLLNPDGTPAPDVAVVLNIDEPVRRPDQPGPTFEVKTNSEGSFEFPPVADGDWRLAAALERSGVKLRALQWIEMAGQNIEDVRLRLAPPFSVQGRIVMDAESGVAVPESPRLIPHAGRIRAESGAASWILIPETMARPGFRTVVFDQAGAIAAEAGRDGTFSFQSVYPDSYRIAPLSAPTGYYLDSVRLGETDVAAAEVQLSSGALPIAIVYKTNGGVVRGAVEKCAGGAVLLVPVDTNMRWFGFLHSVRCDATDHYEIRAVRPGEYYVVAFAGNTSTPYLDEGVLRQARRVSVKAAETATEELSAISE
jgi:hypothetical protein